MMINHKVKIDLVQPGVTPYIHVVQGDVHTRKIIVSLYADRRAWQIPEGATAVIRYRKPDRTSGVYDTLGNGQSAITISGNTLQILVAPEALTMAGKVSLAVTLLLGDAKLSTFEIGIWVQEDCTTSLPDESGAWISGLLPAPEKAEPGQHFVVSKVDSSGRVLSVAAVDSAEGSANLDVAATVGQTIVVKSVDENGKPTAWEAVNHQEQTHSMKERVLLPETSATFYEEEGFFVIAPLEFPFKDSTYKVTYNGTDYICPAQFFLGLWILGNSIPLGLPSGNQVPFFLVIEDNALLFLPLDGATSVDVGISELEYIKIPTSYLPDGAPYYIHASVEWDAVSEKEIYICHNTTDEVYSAYESNRFMVLRLMDLISESFHIVFCTLKRSFILDGATAFEFEAELSNSTSGATKLYLVPQADGFYALTSHLE